MESSAHDISYLESFVLPERIERMKAVLSARTQYLTVALENIYQPHNGAAVLRSCDGFGIQDVHIIENSNKFQKTKGVALGADKWLTLNRYNKPDEDNTPACFEALKKGGYKIAALTLREGCIPIDEVPLDQPLALAFGTELTGLTETAHELSDYYVQIPMRGFVESFNISVCAALSLYSLRTRLEKEVADYHIPEEQQSPIYYQWLMKSIRGSEKIMEDYKADKS